MSTFIDLNGRDFQKKIETCSFKETILQVDDSVETIVKILSSLKKDLPLCLLPKTFPAQKKIEIEKRLLNFNLEKASLLFLTSGTTHEPKIVQLSKQALFFSALNGHDDFNLKSSDCYGLNLPFHHIAGVMVLLRAYVSNALLSYDTNLATHLSLVSTQLVRNLPKPGTKVLLGGGPIPLALCQKASEHGVELFTTYGMTQTASQVTVHHFSIDDRQLLLGHPLKGRELKIDASGEILVKGKTLFCGYLGEKREQEDWFYTKDIGRYTEKGLEVLGRKDRMFISGGENIYPEEIEKAFLEHPSIFAALVKGIEDQELGRKCIAYYAAQDELCPHSLKEFLRQRLPSYKIPKELIFSITSSGKGMVSLV